MDNEIISKVKYYFLKTFERSKKGYPFLPRHVEKVEKCCEKFLNQYPNANKEVVILSVWLHDIGQNIDNSNDDHAVQSEIEARKILSSLNCDKKLIEMVAHCVRAHRCRDVQPQSIEAKILSVADSASHMIDINYIIHLADKPKSWVIDKLERDYRDMGMFPEIQKEFKPIYEAWKALLNAFPNN